MSEDELVFDLMPFPTQGRIFEELLSGPRVENSESHAAVHTICRIEENELPFDSGKVT